MNGYHSEYLLEEPKLIIRRVGVKCGVMQITKPKSWVTDNALIVEPKKDAFDIQFLKLKLGFENLNKLSVSTAQPIISGSKIYAYEILLPPKPTQQAIVSKIEELFSELDKGIENLRIAQQQLKIYRQSVLKWAFEGKLTNENVKEGELLKGWKWMKLGELMESVRNGYSKKPDEIGKYKILRISSVRSNKVYIDEVRFLEKEIGIENSLAENDLLFTRYISVIPIRLILELSTNIDNAISTTLLLPYLRLKLATQLVTIVAVL